MAEILTKYTNGRVPMPIPVAEEEVVARVTIPVTTAQLVLNNVFSFFVLPADCLLVAYTLRADSLDSNGSKTIALDVGFINSTLNGISALAADGGAKTVAGSTLAQAGGILTSIATAAAWKQIGLIPSQAYDRKFGVAIAAAPATAQAGDLELQISYRPA